MLSPGVTYVMFCFDSDVRLFFCHSNVQRVFFRFVLRKPSMTFGAAATPNGSGGSGGGAKGKGAAGQNVENKELAARQQKGLAQATARKRRILGVGLSFATPEMCHTAELRL